MSYFLKCLNSPHWAVIMLVTRFWRNNSNTCFFFFFFLENSKKRTFSTTPPSSWFSELPVFLYLVHWQETGTYVQTFWVVRHSLSGVLSGGSCCPGVLGPGNMSPWRCASRKGCGHTFGKCFVLHSLLGSSSALWGVKSTKKSFKEDTCLFVFKI